MSKYPKCGAEGLAQCESIISFDCGLIMSNEVEMNDPTCCLRRQVSRLTSEVERLKAELKEAKGGQ